MLFGFGEGGAIFDIPASLPKNDRTPMSAKHYTRIIYLSNSPFSVYCHLLLAVYSRLLTQILYKSV